MFRIEGSLWAEARAPFRHERAGERRAHALLDADGRVVGHADTYADAALAVRLLNREAQEAA